MFYCKGELMNYDDERLFLPEKVLGAIKESLATR